MHFKLLLALCRGLAVVRDQRSPLCCIWVDVLLLTCDSVSLLLAMRAMPRYESDDCVEVVRMIGEVG